MCTITTYDVLIDVHNYIYMVCVIRDEFSGCSSRGEEEKK